MKNILPSVNIISRELDNSGDHPQFKFKLELTKGKKKMKVDYSGGIHAFLPAGYDKSGKTHLQLLVDSVIDVKGVCHSLLMDTEAGEETFEDFCGNFGYDEDSRSAEKIHKQCKAYGKRFRNLIGEDYAELEELLAEY